MRPSRKRTGMLYYTLTARPQKRPHLAPMARSRPYLGEKGPGVAKGSINTGRKIKLVPGSIVTVAPIDLVRTGKEIQTTRGVRD